MSAQYASLTAAFELFAKIADAQGEQYRALAYRRANATGMGGTHISTKIAEYRATGHIRELDELLARPGIQASLEFDKLLGFGPTTIKSLIVRGITTRAALLDHVKRQEITLTRLQDLGLRYYMDLQRAIPRADVTRVSELIFAEIFKCARDVIIETTGSYRRRAPESNDIDILTAGAQDSHEFLHNLHARMSAQPFFVDIITLGDQKYSFLMRFRWVISIDIIHVARESYYSALLYFTGSQSFNIWMRELCKKKGFSLNQYELRAPNGTLIHLQSEEQIFEILGIPYVAPANRSRAVIK